MSTTILHKLALWSESFITHGTFVRFERVYMVFIEMADYCVVFLILLNRQHDHTHTVREAKLNHNWMGETKLHYNGIEETGGRARATFKTANARLNKQPAENIFLCRCIFVSYVISAFSMCVFYFSIVEMLRIACIHFFFSFSFTCQTYGHNALPSSF